MSNHDLRIGRLYNKYRIEKTDGSVIDKEAVYFVLRLDSDPHARTALQAYADSIRAENKEFADDLENILISLDRHQFSHPLNTII